MGVFISYIEPQIEKSLYNFLKSSRRKALFGKGRQASIVNDMCRMVEIVIDSLISTQEEDTAEEFMRHIKSYSLSMFPEAEKENTDVLIAVNEKWNSEIEYSLRECGFVHIYKVENWKLMNRIFRESYFEYIMQKNGIDSNNDILCHDGFRIYNWKQMGREYEESFLVEAVDILYPFLFNDTIACVEGPYELGRVKCRDGIVIDAGANIGMFSCCAASRGCKVYAFEPTKTAREFLHKNAELYSGCIDIDEHALSDTCGIASFSVNDMGEGTRNRFCELLTDGFHLEKVNTVTLDYFIEHGPGKVDFIKADIEGAERKMLMGAQKVLREFGPKLSLCTYHLPDDKEVLTDLILTANSDYRIMYGWHKLYAYIP